MNRLDLVCSRGLCWGPRVTPFGIARGIAIGLLGVWAPGLAAAPDDMSTPVEVVNYATRTADDPDSEIFERVSMVIGRVSNRVVTVYTSYQPDGREHATICMATNGALVEARQTVTGQDGSERASARVWTAGGVVYNRRTRPGGRVRLRQHSLDGLNVVADAGLLVQLRGFPFDAAKRLDVLMVSFDQHFIKMHLQLAGTEMLATALGEISCYRVEGTIDLFIKKFRMTYWLSVAPPHRLIRYEGKRGLFLAPTYVTEIQSLTLHPGETGRDLLLREMTTPLSDNP